MKRKIAVLFALVFAISLTACGDVVRPGSTPEASSTGGVDDGRIGEVIHTYFYDFVVNDATLADEYYGYSPAEGNRLLIANVTIQNTSRNSITMADAEFMLLWDDEEGITIPITSDPETGEEVPEAYVNDEQLPYEFDLGINEQTWGYFVYEVPAGFVDFAIVTEDSFEGGETGDLYVVYFTPDDPAQD